MNDFIFYLTEGIFHILDFNGLDHCLFVVLLATRFKLSDWKNLLTVLTAFTLGHSISLYIGSNFTTYINSDIIELLIPITIIVMGIQNILFAKRRKEQTIKLQFIIICGFGLIHGLGFSSFFKAMMMGISDSIVVPLFAFNLGIELGQLIIIVFLFPFLYLLNKGSWPKHRGVIVINSLGILTSLIWLLV